MNQQFKNTSNMSSVERDNINDQLRELQSQVESLTDSITVTPLPIESEIVPGLVNFIDNSDFIFSDGAYNDPTPTYGQDINVLANWYGRQQSQTDAWEENGVAEATNDSIRRSAHTSGASPGVEWNDTEGSLMLTGGYRIGGRLFAKYAFAGNYMVARAQVSKRRVSLTFATTDVNTGTEKITKTNHGMAEATKIRLTTTGALPAPLTIDTDYYLKNIGTNDFSLSAAAGGAAIDLTTVGSGTHTLIITQLIPTDLKLKVSVWTNTENKVIEGTKPVPVLTKIGAHSGGTTTRDYILEVQMPDGRTFYSSTTSPVQITNTVATTSIDSDDYVNIS